MKTFINLPVKSLKRSVDFFEALGFSFDQQFTDENATCMIISDDAYAMLHVEASFEAFSQRAIADTSKTAEVLVGLSAESRAHVDELAGKAKKAGAMLLGEPDDRGFMYMQGFRDLDGHQWSFIFMDTSAFAEH